MLLKTKQAITQRNKKSSNNQIDPLKLLKNTLKNNINLKNQLKSQKTIPKQKNQKQLYNILQGNNNFPTLNFNQKNNVKKVSYVKQRVNSGSLNFDLSIHTNRSLNSSIDSDRSQKSSKSANLDKYKQISRIQVSKLAQTNQKQFNDTHLRPKVSIPLVSQSMTSRQQNKNGARNQDLITMTDTDMKNINKKINQKNTYIKNTAGYNPMTSNQVFKSNQFMFYDFGVVQKGEKKFVSDQYPVPAGIKFKGLSHYKNQFYEKNQTFDYNIAKEIKELHKGILKQKSQKDPLLFLKADFIKKQL